MKGFAPFHCVGAGPNPLVIEAVILSLTTALVTVALGVFCYHPVACLSTCNGRQHWGICMHGTAARQFANQHRRRGDPDAYRDDLALDSGAPCSTVLRNPNIRCRGECYFTTDRRRLVCDNYWHRACLREFAGRFARAS